MSLDPASKNPVEILLVEDNPSDLKLALHAFRQHNLANSIQVARDGARAASPSSGSGPTANPPVP